MTALRTALVTGANRGIGRAVSLALHRLGYAVVTAARDGDEAREAAAALGAPARAVALDVTDGTSIERARERTGHVDVLVNNAGVLLDAGSTPSTVPLDLVERTLRVNTLGSWRVTQAFLPGMLARGWGRVVMVSSGTGTFSNGLFPGAPAYSVSKAALNAVTLLLATECQGTGVLVNAVNPGVVRTRMMPGAQRSPEEGAAEVVGAVTLPDDGPSGCLLSRGRVVGW